MRYYPITLGVVRPNWSAQQINMIMPNNPETVYAAIRERDNNTCQCCGFRAENYQQVLHINGNPRDFADDNLLTTCIFCHQCFDLETVNQMQSGMLIWLPEFTQAELNHLARALYLARVVPGAMATTARKIFDVLYERGEEAKRRLGSRDPGALAIVMRDFLTKKEYDHVRASLDGIRLLPLEKRMVRDEATGAEMNGFGTIFAHWRSKVYKDMPAQDWPALYNKLVPNETAGQQK